MPDKIVKSGEPTGALAKRIKSFTGGLTPVSSQTEVLGIRKTITSAELGLDVVFAFDTTGSMYPYFEEVKKKIFEIIDQVRGKSRRVRFGLAAWKNHGDEGYFEGEQAFMAVSPTENIAFIREAMEKVQKGGGGSDALTCIEDVFHHLNTATNWDPRAVKILVLVGDMPPHGILDSKNKCPFGYDYERELAELKGRGVKIYSVFCHEKEELSTRLQKVKGFFKVAAELTEGKFLDLEDINDVVVLLTGICLKQSGHLDDFITTLQTKNLLTPSRQKVLLQLKGGDSDV